jgi:hypothetical protein
MAQKHISVETQSLVKGVCESLDSVPAALVGCGPPPRYLTLDSDDEGFEAHPVPTTTAAGTDGE